jgi:hypothetical protein
MANFPLPCRAECVRAPPVSLYVPYLLSYYALSSPLCYFSFTFRSTSIDPGNPRGDAHKKGGGLWPPPRSPLSTLAPSYHVKPYRPLTTLAGLVWPHQALPSPAMRA